MDRTVSFLTSTSESLTSSEPSASSSGAQRVSPSTPADDIQRCSRCSYTGVISSFPMRHTGAGYLRSCASCISKPVTRKARNANKETPHTFTLTVPTMSLDEYLLSVRCNKDQAFELDAFVEIPKGMFHQDGEHLYSRTNRLRDRLAEASQYHWNQKKSTRGGKATVVTYHCAQLEGEQTRRILHQDEKKRRTRKEKIARYHCGGWLKFTIIDDNDLLVRIRMTHAQVHPPFPDGAGRRKVVKDKDTAEGLHDHGEWAANGLLGEAESAGGGLSQGDCDVVMDASLEVEPEMREEPRVFYSKPWLASLRTNFNLVFDMAEAGVHPELADSFKTVFEKIKQTAQDIQTASAESRGETYSKRRRTS